MNSTIINIKTDPKIKKEAKKITAEMGLTLSGAINGFLRQLIRSKTVLFTLNENAPSDYLLSSIKESEKEKRDRKFYSFKSNKEAIKFLDKQFMQIEYSKKFIKEFKKCSPKVKIAFKNKLKIFINNPHNPILNNHKLSGKLKKYRSININANWRAIFQEIIKEKSIYFVAIGTHSKLYS